MWELMHELMARYDHISLIFCSKCLTDLMYTQTDLCSFSVAACEEGCFQMYSLTDSQITPKQDL